MRKKMQEIILNQTQIMHRVAYFRNANNISASQLSKKLGHSRSYIYRLESCQIKLDLQILMNILELLQVSTSEFFFYDFMNYKENMRSLSTLNKLTPSEKSILLSFINSVKS